MRFSFRRTYSRLELASIASIVVAVTQRRLSNCYNVSTAGYMPESWLWRLLMRVDDDMLTNAEAELLATMQSLRSKLDLMSMQQYRRINPFLENVTDWHQRGEQFGSPGTVIHDSSIVLGDVQFGDSVWIGPYCLIDGSGHLSIGSSVTIASGCQVYTHDTIKSTVSGGKVGYEYAPVTIGANVFIGAMSVILKGVTIGECSVVGANSTVACDIPSYSIAAGTPARVIGRVCISDDGVELVYHDNGSDKKD
jgi:acetyltransferase-like isoleucine patch superfamily enzyme